MEPTESNDNRLIDFQVRRNSDSSHHWERARPHRQQVTRLITDDVSAGDARLCILGAGNCNDIDLVSLADQFAEVHLVDLDTKALQSAVIRQDVVRNPSMHLHGDCDVTGVFDRLAMWSPEHLLNESELQRVIQMAGSSAGLAIPGPFDVVASVCLLSQLIEAVIGSLGEDHGRFLELLSVIRQRHVRLLAELTAPGGTGILITDFVSSDSAPELPAVADDQLPAVLSELIEAHNFFHGLNPAVIASLFKQDAVIAPLVASIELPKPWLWDFDLRHYAVAAFKFRRK